MRAEMKAAGQAATSATRTSAEASSSIPIWGKKALWLAPMVCIAVACSRSEPPGAVPVADAAPVARPDAEWPPASEAVALRATLSSDRVPLLSPVTLTLDLVVADSVLGLPGFDPSVPQGFRGTRRPAVIAPLAWGEHQGNWTRFVMDLVPLKLGTVEVPGFTVAASDSEAPPRATTAPLTLEVSSVLAAGDPGDDLPPDPAQPKGSMADADASRGGALDPAQVLASRVEPPTEPFAPPFQWVLWSGVLGAVLLLVGVGWFLARQSRKPKPERAVPPEPADRVALRELAALRDAPRTTPAEVESFYVRLSAVLRRYLEGRYGLRAPERTTEEFLAEAEATAHLQPEQRETLRRFLAQCDLVKFAGMQPPPHVHDETFVIAEQFVQTTRAVSSASRVAGSLAMAGVVVPEVAWSAGTGDASGWWVFWPFGREDFDLLDPWFLGLIPVACAVCVLSLLRRRAAVAYADPLAVGGDRHKSLPTTARIRLRWLPLVLQTLAFGVLVYALARPVFRELVPLQSEGVDILLVLEPPAP